MLTDQQLNIFNFVLNKIVFKTSTPNSPVNLNFFKQVNWKYNPGVKYYKFKMLYTKLVQC